MNINNRVFNLSIVVFVYAVFLRICKLALDDFLVRDGSYYLLLAERIKSGYTFEYLSQKGYSHPPLPLYLLTKLMGFVYNAETAGRSLNIFLGAMLPVICFYLLRHISLSTKKAFLCSLLIASHHNLIELSIQPLRDNLYLLLAILSVNFALSIKSNHGVLNSILSGIICGLCLCCRFEAIELLFILPILIYYKSSFRFLLAVKRVVLMYSAIIASFFITCIYVGNNILMLNDLIKRLH